MKSLLLASFRFISRWRNLTDTAYKTLPATKVAAPVRVLICIIFLGPRLQSRICLEVHMGQPSLWSAKVHILGAETFLPFRNFDIAGDIVLNRTKRLPRSSLLRHYLDIRILSSYYSNRYGAFCFYSTLRHCLRMILSYSPYRKHKPKPKP